MITILIRSVSQPRPYAAIDLIHQQPVRWVNERIVSCDGGGGPLGHPKIFINTDKPQICWCTYCGLPFVRVSAPELRGKGIQEACMWLTRREFRHTRTTANTSRVCLRHHTRLRPRGMLPKLVSHSALQMSRWDSGKEGIFAWKAVAKEEEDRLHVTETAMSMYICSPSHTTHTADEERDSLSLNSPIKPRFSGELLQYFSPCIVITTFLACLPFLNSRYQTPCHVPSAILPSLIGTMTLAPTNALLTCAGISSGPSSSCLYSPCPPPSLFILGNDAI